MTQQYNILAPAIQTAQGLQGLRSQQQAYEQQQMQQEQYAQQQQQQQAQAAQQQRMQQLQQQYAQTQDPALMRQIIVENPEVAASIQKQFGILDTAQADVAINQAASLKQMIEQDPVAAQQYWQQNLSQSPAFAGLADNFQNQDYSGAINEIGWGITAIGGQQAYDNLYGAQERTDFVNDLMQAGLQPGSQEFKDAVLEKYGKGQTIGYDVIEAVNPETGVNEYFQVSRVNPNEKISLGIQVPQTAAEVKAADAAKTAEQKELETAQDTLSTIGKILSAPGLSGFSGLILSAGLFRALALQTLRHGLISYNRKISLLQ